MMMMMKRRVNLDVEKYGFSNRNVMTGTVSWHVVNTTILNSNLRVTVALIQGRCYFYRIQRPGSAVLVVKRFSFSLNIHIHST